MFLVQFSMVRSSVSITKHKTLLTLHHKPRFGNLNKKYPRESHTLLVKKQSPPDSFPSTINDLGIRKKDIQFPIKIVVGLFWPISLVLQTSTRSSLGSIIGTHKPWRMWVWKLFLLCNIDPTRERGWREEDGGICLSTGDSHSDVNTHSITTTTNG